MQGGRAARQCDGMRHAGHGRDFALEFVDMRAERRSPSRVERVQQKLPIDRPDVGRRQIDALHRSTTSWLVTP
jgi:hypothetical protein